MAASFRILVLAIRVFVKVDALEIVEVKIVDVRVDITLNISAFVGRLAH